ncbi:hypothetical protein QC761_0112480 [Podospora bellae-mahoneyi]|uniref:Uncharacterized protein n=1 Tax=Podospora bellae-mahoneyi TaxID=2093777 RepID=A0ABR0F825_9PEZI|nr:hypothetical protein QC761_0112480 [Podospora bellae-mahoneyi]
MNILRGSSGRAAKETVMQSLVKLGFIRPQDKITVATQPDAGVGMKRKRNDDDAGLRICGLCNKKFDEGANGQSACSYHPAVMARSLGGGMVRTKLEMRRKSQGVIELSQMKILDVGDKDEDNEENDNQETGDEENQDEDC